jgi:hypothetical protein
MIAGNVPPLSNWHFYSFWVLCHAKSNDVWYCNAQSVPSLPPSWMTSYSGVIQEYLGHALLLKHQANGVLVHGISTKRVRRRCIFCFDVSPFETVIYNFRHPVLRRQVWRGLNMCFPDSQQAPQVPTSDHGPRVAELREWSPYCRMKLRAKCQLLCYMLHLRLWKPDHVSLVGCSVTADFVQVYSSFKSLYPISIVRYSDPT